MTPGKSNVPLAMPISEPDQLLRKQPSFKATIDFHAIIVRKQQKVPSRLCGDERVPAEIKSKRYCFRQVFSLMRLDEDYENYMRSQLA